MKRVTRFECRCERCNHTWVTRSSERPVKCPGCGSAYWDREPVRVPSNADKDKPEQPEQA